MRSRRLDRLGSLTRGVALVGISVTGLACGKEGPPPEPVHTNATATPTPDPAPPSPTTHTVNAVPDNGTTTGSSGASALDAGVRPPGLPPHTVNAPPHTNPPPPPPQKN